MRYQGTARLDRRTKDLVKRLGPGDIAIIDHADMDRVSAEMLLETGVEVVVNASQSISGVYPNVGPLLLARGGVAGPRRRRARRSSTASRRATPSRSTAASCSSTGRSSRPGTRLTVEAVEEAMELREVRHRRAARQVRAQHARRSSTRSGRCSPRASGLPAVRTEMHGRHVLVVVRGYDYKADLDALRPYIREMRPVLIGVDGGADAIIEAGLQARRHRRRHGLGHATRRCAAAPSSSCTRTRTGRAPGMERLTALGLTGTPWPLQATSEDLALLLPYELGRGPHRRRRHAREPRRVPRQGPQGDGLVVPRPAEGRAEARGRQGREQAVPQLRPPARPHPARRRRARDDHRRSS